MVLRAALTLGAFWLALSPVLAAGRPVLRSEISVSSDVVTLGDLVEGGPAEQAARPLFRAPALGATGTIQVQRILDAVLALGVGDLDTAGRSQVTVARAARLVPQAEIEAALRATLEQQSGLDLRSFSITFEGAPSLLVPPELKSPPAVEDLVHDRRARRVSALVSLGSKPGDRRASLRVSGTLVEIVEVAVLNRSIQRGEAIRPEDISIERRARDTAPADAQEAMAGLAGRVARRALGAGSLVRQGDLIRPEIIARGEIVTIVYETPGLMLTLRGRANEAGAQGDTIAVVNPQSKKVLQATVTGPGRVSVGAMAPGPVATAAGRS
jgi:flagella basal body P-ring formation protein FlgA